LFLHENHPKNGANKGIFFEEESWFQKMLGNSGEQKRLCPESEKPTAGYQHEDALWFKNEKHTTYHPLAKTIVKRFPNAKTVLELGCGACSLAY
jgi:hypothetical protein